ncbi:MAG: type II toxin-antitoxin system prevent-host-death family antitoxin [Dokdonella sp.]
MNTRAKPVSKGVEEARQQLPSILSAASEGRTTLITRHGRAIAAVVPVSKLTSIKPSSLLALAGSGCGMWDENSAAAIASLRDEWSR